jgi:mono/diheme cytochrome c family protein
MMRTIVHALAFFAVLGLVSAARAQENLDRNQSGPKLFAASCVQCHKSARGLAKGRISFTLSYYLRSHYTSSSESASVLTAYLQSVDTPPAKAKRAAGKTQTSKTDAGKTQPKGTAKKDVETRLPTGTISEDPRVKPPAKIPGR